ncbi:MAG: hypothetical protein U0168_00680 [Nannocystaceae bacterium]
MFTRARRRGGAGHRRTQQRAERERPRLEQLVHELAQRRLRRPQLALAREAFELGRELAGGGEASVALGRERAHDDALEVLGEVLPLGRRQRHVAVDDAVHQPELVVAVEQARHRRALVQHDAQGEHVAAAVQRLGPALLGRHVRHLALADAGLGDVGARGDLGDAEVGHLHAAVVGDHHVGRRDVAMHEPQRHAVEADALVGVVQARGRAHRDGDRELDRQQRALATTGPQDGLQVLAVDVLHREEELGALAPDVEHLHDVGVIEDRGQARLGQEHPHELGIGREVRQDPLEHEQLLEALEPGRTREVDLGHATRAQPTQQLVAPEPIARGARARRRTAALCCRVGWHRRCDPSALRTGSATGRGACEPLRFGAIVRRRIRWPRACPS